MLMMEHDDIRLFFKLPNLTTGLPHNLGLSVSNLAVALYNLFSIFQEGKLKDSCMIGPSDIPLEDKTVTIVFGTDMCNADLINFVCAGRDLAVVSQSYTLLLL